MKRYFHVWRKLFLFAEIHLIYYVKTSDLGISIVKIFLERRNFRKLTIVRVFAIKNFLNFMF